MCINGEPIDPLSVNIGLADEFAPSTTALLRAFVVARQFIEGHGTYCQRIGISVEEGKEKI